MTKKQMREELMVLLHMVDDLSARLQTLHAEMRNRPPQTRGKPTSLPITPERQELIRKIHMQHPGLPQHEIGKIAGTQQGRVSETLAGKRT